MLQKALDAKLGPGKLEKHLKKDLHQLLWGHLKEEQPKAKAIYTKMTKPLVHGEISGQVKDSRTNSMTLTFCLVKACDIYKKGSYYFLTGLKKDIKQVTVGSEGSFAQRLLPGVYYMNARGENGEVLEGVPVRIDVKAGQVSVWDIQVRMR
jgi:hypothetical protein